MNNCCFGKTQKTTKEQIKPVYIENSINQEVLARKSARKKVIEDCHRKEMEALKKFRERLREQETENP